MLVYKQQQQHRHLLCVCQPGTLQSSAAMHSNHEDESWNAKDLSMLMLSLDLPREPGVPPDNRLCHIIGASGVHFSKLETNRIGGDEQAGK